MTRHNETFRNSLTFPQIEEELVRMMRHASFGNVTAKAYVRDVGFLLESIKEKESVPKLCCSFCKRTFITCNINNGDGNIWNACDSQECKDKINVIIKTSQEQYRRENQKR